MSTSINREAYIRLIDEDLEWLLKQPRTLERDHIAKVLEWSIGQLYRQKEGGETNPRRSAVALSAAGGSYEHYHQPRGVHSPAKRILEGAQS